MKIAHIIFGFSGLLSLCGSENLIRNGDFNLYPNTGGREYRQISDWKHSRFELFTEDLSWNKCGKLKILSLSSDAKGNQNAIASVLVGRSGQETGFKCKPNTTYRYSVQLRGNVSRAFVKGVQWKKDDSFWKFTECTKSKQTVPIGPEWSTIQGTFKTGPDADRAALNIAIWWDSKYKMDKHVLKEGDYLLIDNIKITEVNSVLPSGNASAAPAISDTVKAAPLIFNRTGKTVSADDNSWKDVPETKDFLVLSGDAKKKAQLKFTFKRSMTPRIFICASSAANLKV